MYIARLFGPFAPSVARGGQKYKFVLFEQKKKKKNISTTTYTSPSGNRVTAGWARLLEGSASLIWARIPSRQIHISVRCDLPRCRPGIAWRPDYTR